MKTFQSLHVSLCTLLVAISLVAISNATVARPTIHLFEASEDRRVVKLISSETDSEHVLESVKALKLECTASYPVQWIYSGNGIPLMETKISSSTNEFKATAYIAELKELHTGKYKCASTEQPSVLSYFYIYVPGQNLFNVNSGRTVEIDSNAVQVPCTVSSPRVSVYLVKPVGPTLKSPAQYDPRRGFFFEVQEIIEAEGVYLCKAAYRGATNVLEYQVKVLYGAEPLTNPSDQGLNSTEPPCNPPCAQNAKCMFTSGVSVCRCLAPYRGDGYNVCEREAIMGECRTHQDCPNDKSCFADFVCRDPCTNSVHGLECGKGAICKTVDHAPTCACPGGTYGDPVTGCISVSPALSRQIRQTRECKAHTDCPDNLSCFADYVCRDPCTNTLHGLECGRNAICKTVKHEPTCTCPESTYGDPLKDCNGKPQADEFRPDPVVSTPPPKVSQGVCKTHTDCDDKESCFADGICRDPCVHTNHGLACGLDAICKSINHRPACACPGGYMGDPLKRCYVITAQGDAPQTTPTRAPTPVKSSKCDCGPDCECICRNNADCDNNFFCNGTTCQDPCKNLCGSNAICTAIKGVGYCSCPDGYRGDPWKQCSSYSVLERTTSAPAAPGAVITCSSDSDCPSKYMCENSQCRDPCLKCARYAVCDLYDGVRPTCKCPESYTGDGTVSCTPDLTFEIPSVHHTVQDTACSSISCGPNSECRIVDGLPKCNCISGYTGNPPNCKSECASNNDCKDNQVCVQKRCRSACLGKCAKGARCQVDPQTKSATCKCRKGFEGDPEKECLPATGTRDEPRGAVIGF